MALLSLAMIVKNEGSTIERVLDCARSFCEEMIVVDTGSTDDTVAKAKSKGAIAYAFDWVDDFSAARNFAFSKCTGDWIIWLDGDDLVPLESQAAIRDLKRLVLNNELDAVYLRYKYPPFLQWRERIIRRDLFGSKLIWREPIHEVINGIDAQRVRYFDAIFIVHAPPQERQALKIDRNLNILRKHYENGARDERTLYVYAIECLHNLYREEAIEVLERFFASVKQSDYRYEVYCKMYDFFMYFDECRSALDALSRAIVEDATRAEAYYKLGKHFLDKTDQPASAIPLLTVASLQNVPRHGIPEMAAYTYGPWESLCRANFRMEKYDLAKDLAGRALQHNPPAEVWIRGLAEADLDGSGESLPTSWEKWALSNLERQVPRWHIARVLEENHFSAVQIATTLRSIPLGASGVDASNVGYQQLD